jgi:hypothetical protein
MFHSSKLGTLRGLRGYDVPADTGRGGESPFKLFLSQVNRFGTTHVASSKDLTQQGRVIAWRSYGKLFVQTPERWPRG